MFRISYFDENGNARQKGGFSSDKAANDWVKAQGDKIAAMRLLIWSEEIQCFRPIANYPAYEGYAKAKGWA